MTTFCRSTQGNVYVKGPGSDYSEAQNEAEYALRNWSHVLLPGEEISPQEFAERLLTIDHPDAEKISEAIGKL